MNWVSSSSNIYSNSPELPGNPILASLRILFWLIFHPSAWRSYVHRLDPDLPSNFCLADLSQDQWRKPDLRRLQLMAFVIWPILVGLLIGLLLRLAGKSGEALTFSVSAGVAVSMVSSMVISAMLSVAGGITAGVIGGISGGFAGYAVFAAMPDAAVDITLSVSVGLTAGITAAIAASTVSRGLAHYSISRQMGGVVVGVLISSVAVGVAACVVFTALSAGVGEATGITTGVTQSTTRSIVVGLLASVILGTGFGIAFRWCTRKRNTFQYGFIIGLMLVVSISLSNDGTLGVVRSAAKGVSVGIIFSVLFALPYALAEAIAGPWAGAVAGTLGSCGVFLVFSLVIGDHSIWPILPLNLACLIGGLSLAWWRPVVMYPLLAAWNTLLYYTDRQRSASQTSLLPRHSAFWDEHQRLPLYGLDNYLVMIAERKPAEGQAAIEYLSTGYQRWAAQTAQLELETRWARWLARCPDVEAIARAHLHLVAGESEGPASSLLRSFSRYSQDVEVAMNQTTPYHQRLALRDVEIRLNRLSRELEQRNDAYATSFYPVAAHWHQVITAHVKHLVKMVELSQEIDNPYILGIPLTEQQEIFVGRTDISNYIEQLLSDRRRPSLLLYGQRRMGKTSLLHNLVRLLPTDIVLLYVDGQGIAGASDYADFLYNIARQMAKSASHHHGLKLSPINRDALTASPFTSFNEWLDDVEQFLVTEGRSMALLALDEFEALDSVLDKGRFDETDLLNMLRHLNQHRPRIKVLLAGSHTLEEFQRWASYLINMQVVHLDYLKENEARQLIERPVKNFVLHYEPEASQRALALTRGHPYLVQLLCYEIVGLKNEQSPTKRRLVRHEDVAAAVPRALSHGSFFFADIERNQVDAAGAALLRFLALQGEGAVASHEALTQHIPNILDRTLTQLIQRELIESVGNGYRFQVELIRRWFAQSLEVPA